MRVSNCKVSKRERERALELNTYEMCDSCMVFNNSFVARQMSMRISPYVSRIWLCFDTENDESCSDGAVVNAKAA